MNQNEMVFCRECGRQMHYTAPVCPGCGVPRVLRATKSKGTAALLAFFFGWLGVHRFYLGQWWGIFYLLFCWTFIPQIVAVVEMIVFLCTSEEKWQAKYSAQAGGGSGVGAIIAIVGVIVGVAIIGILAAIALPAYQDYTMRAKTTQAYEATVAAQQAVGNYYQLNKDVPKDLATAGFDISSLPKVVRNIELNPENGILTVYVNANNNQDLSLTLTPSADAQNKVSWTCSSDNIRVGWLPHPCRK